MEFGKLTPAEFLKRENRFVCRVRLDGQERKAFIRNTGRLRELLKEGARVFLKEKASGKYRWELMLVESPGSLVCVDSQLPPKLLLEFMQRTGSPWKVTSYKTDPRFGNSKFDLLVNEEVMIETKSVNLVINGVALFPDAPTLRGKRHVEELSSMKDYRAAVVFVVQREDARLFSPNTKTDPNFAKALSSFYKIGGIVKAFLCQVSLEGIDITGEIPVKL